MRERRENQEFWQLLADLKLRLSGSWGNDREYRRLFVRNPIFRKRVYDYFHLSGAAIAMLDLDRKVRLLQTDYHEARRDLTVDLPFVASKHSRRIGSPRGLLRLNPEAFSRVVHQLFIRRRERQTAVGLRNVPLSGSEPIAVDEMPEFLRHLPNGFAPPEPEKESDQIYCPAPEVYHYVLLWRWLLWLGAKFGQLSTLSEIEFEAAWAEPTRKGARLLGDKAYWREIGYDASKLLPESIMTASDGVLQRLRKMSDSISRQDVFAHDCQLMGVADERGKLTEFGRVVAAFRNKTRSGGAVTVKDLARTLHARIGQEVHGKTLSGVLSWLHCNARFPIIPYFYLTLLDGQPKAHLAFPVLRSVAFSVDDSAGARDQKQSTSAVAVALFSLNWQPEEPQVVDQRLREIEIFFKTVSDRMLDQVFYGRFKREELLRRGAADTLHQLTKDFRVYQRDAENFTTAWEAYRQTGVGEPPKPPVADGLAVSLMLLVARDERRVFEQPEGCRRCVAGVLNAEAVDAELIARAVWPQAVARVGSDPVLRSRTAIPGVVHVTDEEIAKYFGRPKLIIASPFEVRGPETLLPVLIVALRNAYEHALRWTIERQCPGTGEVELEYREDRGEQIVTIWNSGQAPGKGRQRQVGWQRDQAILSGVPGMRWKVERDPRGGFSAYSRHRSRWATRIVGLK